MKLAEVTEYIKHENGIIGKETVLEYMKKQGKHYAIAAGPAKDHFTGKSTGITEECFTDGVYCWTFGTMYHFEKYNTPITPEFVDHVCSVIKEK